LANSHICLLRHAEFERSTRKELGSTIKIVSGSEDDACCSFGCPQKVHSRHQRCDEHTHDRPSQDPAVHSNLRTITYGRYYNRLSVNVAAIINPVSGAGANPNAAKDRIQLLKRELDRRGLHASIALTTRAGHATELAREFAAARVDLLIVWGGDGTVNESGGAVAGTETAIGLVPAGSGNGLAAALGTSRDPVEAIRRALDGHRRAIDAGVIAGRPFFNIAGIGVDAVIARRFNERAQGTRGPLPYFLIGVAEGCRYRGEEYDIDLDGDRCRLRALLIAFANGQEYGVGARLSAGARLDDGLLNAVIVEDRPIVARFWHARYLKAGTPERAPRVIARPVHRATIRRQGTIEFHADGEIGSAENEVVVSINRAALWVVG
jgi:YegS/Rv2252/BmrU family lipid kinase